MANASTTATNAESTGTPTGGDRVEVSVVLPAFEEVGALPGLIEELDGVLAGVDGPHEMIVVDDGSRDGTGELLESIAAAHEPGEMIVVRLGRNLGKSAALAAGFERSRGDRVVTLDADGQDDPAEIPGLLAKLDEGYDLVSGWKQNRQDPSRRRWASKVFNRTTARISGVELHDMNNGLKAYRGEQIRSLSIYGELHRFIPVLGAQRGWRVTEVPVNHRERVHGHTKFGLERYLRGLFDLLAVLFMDRYGNRPLHLFGGLGFGCVLLGVLLGVYLTIEKLTGNSIGDRPLLLLAVLLVVVGIQFFTFGLLAQMIVAMRNEHPERSPE